MRRKTMKDFLKENREILDRYITNIAPNCKLNDTERKNWVMNDEFLYHFARREGVRI